MGVGAHDLEAAEVGAQQDASLIAGDHRLRGLIQMHAHVELVETSVEQEYPVQDRRSKGMDMAQSIADARLAPQHLAQVFSRSGTCIAGKQQEI